VVDSDQQIQRLKDNSLILPFNKLLACGLSRQIVHPSTISEIDFQL
jgi:hypothetical protein